MSEIGEVGRGGGVGRVGRPRSERARLAVLDATVELLASTGYDRLTIDAIAARAGVGRQTIYRWWTSKGSILAEAALSGRIPPRVLDVPDTGRIESDLRVWLRSFAAEARSAESAPLIRALTSAAADSPDDSGALYRLLAGPSHDAIVGRLRRAQDGGELRRGADLVAAADALLGAVLYRLLAQSDNSDAATDGLVDVVVGGILPPPVVE